MRFIQITLMSLLSILPPAGYSEGIDHALRIEYSSTNDVLPNNIQLATLAETLQGAPDDRAVGIVLGLLNQIRYDNGAIGIPSSETDWTFSRSAGERLAARINETYSKVKTQHREVVRVIACPETRVRPSQGDVWIAMQAAVDMEDMIWEEHRYILRKEFGDAIDTVLKNSSPGYRSRRYDLAKLNADNPNPPFDKLNRFCSSFGL